jgi:hypothetical protein
MTIEFDIAWDVFGRELVAGEDVTSAFGRDIAHPIIAKVVNPCGPGGGNPIVRFTFQDEDHAWEWASTNMDMCPEDFAAIAA